MRLVGIEPTLRHRNWILSPARLPVPPQPHIQYAQKTKNIKSNKHKIFTQNVKRKTKVYKIRIFYNAISIPHTHLTLLLDYNSILIRKKQALFFKKWYMKEIKRFNLRLSPIYYMMLIDNSKFLKKGEYTCEYR